MKQIFRYEVAIYEPTQIRIPFAAEIVHVAYQRSGCVTFWAIVDREQACEIRTFLVVATGIKLPDNTRYIGTIQDFPLVWHLVEVM